MVGSETTMLDKVQRRLTPDEFYRWQEPRDDKYELVDGYPVRMMTGATRRHDQIVVNILEMLVRQLRGTGCRPFSSDTLVSTSSATRRRPDVGVECGPLRDNDFSSNEPKMVVEVLSPSAREFDLYNKIAEYKTLASLEYILFVEPNSPQVFAWSRGSDRAWSDTLFEGLEAVIALPGLSLMLPLAGFYQDLSFRPTPRLVSGDDT
jgi:Uma2 family endonuclease